ncbi:hypothetical protein RY27_02590, partial [Litorilinea aerophila]
MDLSGEVAKMREEYRGVRLLEEEAGTDPLALFARWLADAMAAELHEPNAMTLANPTADGRPPARMVLVKGFDGRGVCFYTNYEGRKGQELAENPGAALV